jgi:hypothetical protein
MRYIVILALALLACRTEDVGKGCGADIDCPLGLSCVHPLSGASASCTWPCDQDSDCNGMPLDPEHTVHCHLDPVPDGAGYCEPVQLPTACTAWCGWAL